MNTKQIFISWGITTPEVDYLPEYLISTLPSNCFFIDSLPLAVDKDDSIKFDQIEKELYGEMQKKLLNIATKLWLYCDVYFESDLLFRDQTIKKVQDLFPEVYDNFRHISSVQAKSDLIQVADINQLRALLELSYKDIIDLSLYFDQYQIMITPSWSCFFTFINSKAKLDLIQHIINVEGLYLRKFSSNHS